MFLVPKIFYSIQVYKMNIYFNVQKKTVIILILHYFSSLFLIKLLESVARTCFVKSIELLISFKVLTIH